MAVRADDLRAALEELGIAGRPVEVHASMRSFGRLDAGAATIVDGVLRAGCTLVAATMTGDRFAAPAPSDDRPSQNGLEYGLQGSFSGKDIFDPSSTAVAPWLGAFSAHVAARSDRVRAPLSGTFSAIGPGAEALMQAEGPEDVYGPLRALVDADGCVVLMGVGLTRMTLLHLAEVEAGRRPFIRWTRGPAGTPIRVRGGECSEGFDSLGKALAPIERNTTVGATSWWRAFPAASAVALAAAAIAEDPGITRCEKAGCIACADAISGGPVE